MCQQTEGQDDFGAVWWGWQGRGRTGLFTAPCSSCFSVDYIVACLNIRSAADSRRLRLSEIGANDDSFDPAGLLRQSRIGRPTSPNARSCRLPLRGLAASDSGQPQDDQELRPAVAGREPASSPQRRIIDVIQFQKPKDAGARRIASAPLYPLQAFGRSFGRPII